MPYYPYTYLVLYSYTIHDAMMLSAVKSAAVLTFGILANAKNERCDSLHGTVVDFYMGPHPDAGTITLSTLTSALTRRPHICIPPDLESHGLNQCLEIRRLSNVIRKRSFPTLVPNPSLILSRQLPTEHDQRMTDLISILLSHHLECKRLSHASLEILVEFHLVSFILQCV